MLIGFGIDPGSHRTGWGVVRVDGNKLSCIGAGVIQLPSEAPLVERVEPLFRELSALLTVHRPDRVFIESVFHQKNVRSALVLGHARGVALLAVRLSGRPLDEITPAEVKKSVTGNGNAEKTQVAAMVRILLGHQETLALDASDALAVAIAGSQRARSPLAAMLEDAKKRRKRAKPYDPTSQR